jgi:hypothetical protein
MAKRRRKRKSGPKRVAEDLAIRRANRPKGGGAAARVLWAALSSNDAVKPAGAYRSDP